MVLPLLWLPPAAAQEPFLIKDISQTNLDSNPTSIVVVGPVANFAATTPEFGRELWKSDGTEVGTVMVKDIGPGSGGSAPTELTKINGILHFAADDGTTGRELWKLDGTEAGTVTVEDNRLPRNRHARNIMKPKSASPDCKARYR